MSLWKKTPDPRGPIVTDHAFRPDPVFGDVFCVYPIRPGARCTWQEWRHQKPKKGWWGR